MNPTDIAATIAKLRREHGTPATLRRLIPGNDPADVTVYATIKEYKPQELSGGIIQGDRWAKISNDDIVMAGWPGPPVDGDLLIVDGDPFTVRGCDPAKMSGVVLSYTLLLRG